MVALTSIVLIIVAAGYGSAQTFGRTPLMGYNSYNQLACTPTDATMRAAINAMVDRGFLAAGYSYFTVDCGWAARDGQRNVTSGALKIDTNRFPSGLQPLSDLARSRGLRWSMYSDAGVRMCDTEVPSPVLGSLGFEANDAEFFKALGTEFLKYDNCYVDSPTNNAPKDARDDFVSRFSTMWNELKRVGIPGHGICQWGVPFSSSSGLQGPAQWTKGISTSFRLSDDIAQGWSNIYRIYNQAIHIARSGNTGPGHFADADLLEVGNPGMSFDEQATHFAAWAMLKSPLMVSTNVPNLSNAALSLLQNKDLIAINQDYLGQSISLVQRWTNDRDLWTGNLANGDLAVLVTDLSNTRRTLTVQWSSLGISSANVRDLFAGTTFNDVASFSKTVNAHGSLALRLSAIKRSNIAAPTYKYIAASAGTIASGANVQSCSGCTSANKVGYIGGGNGGTLTLGNIRTSQATQTVRFDYINGEVGYLGGQNNLNERYASISVNGGPEKTVSFPLSGYNWDRDVTKEYAVELSGFNPNMANTIRISGSGINWAPDLDRIGFLA